MKEVWRDIKGYDGKYQVSNAGRVKTMDWKRTGQERILSLHSDEERRIGITLYKNGEGKRFHVHLLVVMAFPEICGEYRNGFDIHHIDHNPSNNYANNLICISKSEHCIIHNHASRLPHGQKWTSNQYRNFRKSKERHIIQIGINGEELFGWFSIIDCEETTGYKSASICRCCKGLQKTAYGYKWRYAS